MPEVSVVIPLYNKGPYIGRALHSVLSQTFQNFEIIVVDDGSTDNGADIVLEFSDPRIRLIRQQNQGVSNARNRGISSAIGVLVAFLDADDEWSPCHLEVLLRLRQAYPFAGAYTTAYKILEPDGIIRLANYREIPRNSRDGLIPSYFKSAALGDSPMNSSSTGIPRTIFNEMGGFPEDSWWGEDHDLFGKIAMKYPIAFSWYIGAIYHRNALNRTCNRQQPLEAEPFVRTALSSIENGEVPQKILNDLREYIARKEIDRAERYLNLGQSELSKKILRENKSNYFFGKRLILLVMTLIPFPIRKKARYIRKSFIHLVKIALYQTKDN